MKCDHDRPVFGCDGCVARANVGMTLEGGAKVYRFEIERTYSTEVYVAAATAEQAKEDADEVVAGLSATDFDLPEESVVLVGEVARPENEAVWVGGPKGGWE